MPDEATTKCLLQSIMTFLGGGLVGTFIGHFLAIGRDTRNRKHAADSARKDRAIQLLAFLNVWGSEVSANRKILDSNNVYRTVSGWFDDRRREFIKEVTPLGPDFKGEKRNTFLSLIKTITNMTPGEVDSEEGRQKLMREIQKLIVLVRDN